MHQIWNVLRSNSRNCTIEWCSWGTILSSPQYCCDADLHHISSDKTMNTAVEGDKKGEWETHIDC